MARRRCGREASRTDGIVEPGVVVGAAKVVAGVATPNGGNMLSALLFTITTRATTDVAASERKDRAVSAHRVTEGVKNHQWGPLEKYLASPDSHSPFWTSDLVSRQRLTVVESGTRRNDRTASPIVTIGSKRGRNNATVVLTKMAKLSAAAATSIEELTSIPHCSDSLTPSVLKITAL